MRTLVAEPHLQQQLAVFIDLSRTALDKIIIIIMQKNMFVNFALARMCIATNVDTVRHCSCSCPMPITKPTPASRARGK